MTRRVLLVGLDGAEPSLVSPLLEAGALPHLDRLVETGCLGTLRASVPLVRAMQWTTLATGVRAPGHGVQGDVELREDGAGIRPASRAAWRAHALWDWLAAAGLRCAVVGWPATNPASAPSAATIVDDAYAEAFGPGFDAWPMLPDCVTPETLRDALRDVRVHPGDLLGPELTELVPLAREVDQASDHRLTHLAVSLARTSSLHAAATLLAAGTPWDFLAVAYPLLADVQRDFLRFHPPAPDDVAAADARIFGPVVERAYRLQDAMLGRLIECAGDDVTVIVCSPYGFAAGAQRPSVEAAARLAPAVAWHRHAGLFAAAGPGIRADTLVHGAAVHDVAPTILNLFGLRADGLDGSPIDIAPVAEQAQTVHLAATPAEDVPPPGDEELATLDAGAREVIQRVLTAQLANTAEAALAATDYARAAAAFERLVQRHPRDWLARARLARCRLYLGEHEACRILAAEVIAARPDDPWGHLLYASALVLGGEGDEADVHLARARVAGQGLPNVALRLGMLHLLREEWSDAEQSFREAVEAAPRSVEAFDGLGCALHGQDRFDDAIAAFRQGLGIRYHYPLAHLHLAVTLARTGALEAARAAAQTALAQDKSIPGAEALLAHIAGRQRPTAKG